MPTSAPAIRRGGDPRVYTTVATILVAAIKRNAGCEIRVHLIRMRSRMGWLSTYVSVGRWFRRPPDEEWHEDMKVWRGGPLLLPSEVLVVSAAMKHAVVRARELGWWDRTKDVHQEQDGPADAPSLAETNAGAIDDDRAGTR
jgi:hypothetical protein